MTRKKKLKVNGRSIIRYIVKVKTVKSKHTDDMIEIVFLSITTDEGIFEYEIYPDTRHPSVISIRDHIESLLNRAIQDYLNVEITEYKERTYLFLTVQKNPQEQYTGIRI